MAKLEGSPLQKWIDQKTNTAAPAGLQQAAQAGQGVSQSLPAWMGSSTGEKVSNPDQGYASVAQRWYTGANNADVENGWNTDFYNKFITGMNEASEAGEGSKYFINGGTGVVTWDHQDEDSMKEFKFGDVVENGVVTGNVYDDFKGDRRTADLLMADVLMTKEEKAREFKKAVDNPELPELADAIDKIHKTNTKNAELAQQSKDFQGEVEDRKEGFLDSVVDDVVAVAGGIAGGAVMGGGAAAAAGAITGPGALITGTGGAIFGGITGGIGAWLNRDEFTESMARAWEVTRLSNEEHNPAATMGTAVREWAGVAGRFISPMSNVVRGLSDVAGDSRVGDGDSGFYAMDEATGERTVSKFTRALDVVASVGDSMLQFASGPGAKLFMAQMQATIGGEVTGMAFSGGETFDNRRGGFDNIFTDDEGNIDLVSAAAGLGKVGIDTVQMGMARGLMNKANLSRQAEGEAAEYSAGGLITSRLPQWAGGESKAMREAREGGAVMREMAGRRFAVDPVTGKAIASQKTLSVLAPSEALTATTARTIAAREQAKRLMRDAPIDKKGVDVDELYRASSSLAAGERRFTSALVNAFGEATEEVIQTMLEPLSHNAMLDADEIIEAGLYGGAMGLGMSLGTSMNTSMGATRAFGQAQVGYAMMTNGAELTREEYDQMPESTQRSLGMLAGLDKSIAERSYKRTIDSQGYDYNVGVAGTEKLHDAIQTELASELSRLTQVSGGTYMVTQLEDAGEVDRSTGELKDTSMPNDAAGGSAMFVAQLLHNVGVGMESIRAELQRELKQARASLDAAPDNEDAVRNVARLESDIENTRAVEEMSARINEDLLNRIARLAQFLQVEDGEAEAEAELTQTNAWLRDLFHLRDTTVGGAAVSNEMKNAAARAVSLLFARDPNDQRGSYQMLVPQISMNLTRQRTDALLMISNAILPAIRGDFDGDRFRQRTDLWLGEQEFEAARSGVHFIGAGSTVNVGAPAYEKYVVDYMSKAYKSGNPVLQSFVTATEARIARALRRHFTNEDGTPAIDPAVLSETLEKFFQAIRENNPKSRKVLLDGLATRAGKALDEFGRGSLENQWLWIDQVIRANMSLFQREYAMVREVLPEDTPNTSSAKPHKLRTSEKRRQRRAARAAVLGEQLPIELPGESLFRMFQDLWYTSSAAPVLSADSAQGRRNLDSLSSLYRMLGSKQTRSALAELQAKDVVTAKVWFRLEAMATNYMEQLRKVNPEAYRDTSRGEALAVIASMAIPDHTIDSKTGAITPTGRKISLTQYLLRNAVIEERKVQAGVLDLDPDLAEKLNMLERLSQPNGEGLSAVNAERAFIEVAGPQQFVTLLQEDSLEIAPHLSLDQWIRDFLNKSETERTAIRNQLRSSPAYLGRENQHLKSQPYELQDGRTLPDVSAYRAVVDAMLASASNMLWVDKNGDTGGELADRSDRAGTAFQNGQARVRAAMFQLLEMDPKTGELDPELVSRLMRANPDFTRRALELIPNRLAAVAMVAMPDGSARPANWFVEMLTMADPVEAEMHYWRSKLFAELRLLGANATKNEESDEDVLGVTDFSRMPRRMHRLLAHLQADPSKDLLLAEFMQRMEEAKDLKEFLRWLNTTPGFVGAQAPILAWVDDTADFDIDKTSGGWARAGQGGDERLAMKAFQQAADNLYDSVVQERAALEKDAGLRTILRKVMDYDALPVEEQRKLDESDIPSAEERDQYKKFEKAVELAGNRRMGLGPEAMIYQTVGAVLGFNPFSHTKGISATNVQMAGLFEAMRDAFDYVTNYERARAALTATNLEAIGNNPSMMARDAVLSMDASGNAVNSGALTPRAVLDLFDDVETRSLARSIMYPQVIERGLDNKPRTQLLVEKDLGSFLNGKAHRNLFPTATKLSLDSALRYVSLVEAEAARHGGHFAIQRYVNKLVISRTNAATRALSYEDIEDMVVEAYHEVARVLQAASNIAATPHAVQAGDHLLDEITQAAKTFLQMNQSERRLGETLGPDYSAEDTVELLLSERRDQLAADMAAVEKRLGRDPERYAELQAEQALLQTEFDLYRDRIKGLIDNDALIRITDAYLLPPPPAFSGSDEQVREAQAAYDVSIAQRRQALVDYIANNLDILTTAVSGKVAVQAIISASRNGAPVSADLLRPEEWDLVSRTVVGHAVDRLTVHQGDNISTIPYPDADHEDDRAYWDPSYSYLVEEILDRDGPLLKAAVEVRRHAGWDEATSDSDLISLLQSTIADPKRLGPWSTSTARAILQAEERLYSASAEAGIQMPGNGPKRQPAFEAAKRRTYRKPESGMASTTYATLFDLENDDPFHEVDRVDPDGRSVSIPKVQLDGRFAVSVTLIVPAQQGQPERTVDLLTEPGSEVGRIPQFANDYKNEVKESGYREITTERIATEARRIAARDGVRLGDAVVQIEYFHPDDQPENTPTFDPFYPETNWHNNVFFEGTTMRLAADTGASLDSGMWFAEGGIVPVAEAAALDASKLGQPGLQVIEVTPREEVEQLEVNWQSDFAAMLRRKTQKMLEINLGPGKLDTEFYNAVYKDMKMRHFVRVTKSDGTVELWTAERMIAHQRNPELEVTDMQLVIPTDRVLRSMLGEQGVQGVMRLFEDQIEINPDKIPTWSGVRPEMLERFPGLLRDESLRIQDTPLRHRAREQDFRVRTRMPDAERTAHQNLVLYWHKLNQRILTDRGRDNNFGFDRSAALAKATEEAEKYLRAHNISLDMAQAGLPWVGLRDPNNSLAGINIVRDLEAVTKADGYRTGWRYEHLQPGEVAKETRLQGLITSVHEEVTHPGLEVAPSDFVVIELDSFLGDLEEAQKVIEYFQGRGVTLVLAGKSGSSDLRPELGAFLRESLYEPLVGVDHVYHPVDLSKRYRNEYAKASSLLALDELSRENLMAIFNSTDLPLDEGAAWVDVYEYDEDGTKRPNERLRSVAVPLTLVPVDFLGGYNVPRRTLGDSLQQVERAKAVVARMSENLPRVLEMANGHIKDKAARAEADEKFLKDWNELVERLDRNEGVLPERGDKFGTGTFIPLINTTGDVMLYRHGYKAPMEPRVREMAATPLEEGGLPGGFSVFPSIVEPAANTLEGATVVQFSPRSITGLQVELRVPLSVFGDKMQLEYNGLKYVVTPRPKNLRVPPHGFYRNWGIDLFASTNVMLSKEGIEGAVTNHRMAFAVFGVDFGPRLFRVFVGPDEAYSEQRLINLLERVERNIKKMPLPLAEELMRAYANPPSELMRAWTESLGGLDLDDAISDFQGAEILDDPDVQVAFATLLYLSVHGTQYTDILRSGGLDDDSTGLEARALLMPRLFTQFFDRLPEDSRLRRELNTEFNDHIYNPLGDGRGYSLGRDWVFRIFNGEPVDTDKRRTARQASRDEAGAMWNMEGLLQIAEVHSSGDNPVRTPITYDPGALRSVSTHDVGMAFSALHGFTGHSKGLKRTQKFVEQAFSNPQDLEDGGVWRVLKGLPKDRADSAWRVPTLAESVHDGRAREAMLAFQKDLNKDKWDDKQKQDYKTAASAFLASMNLPPNQISRVDTWIRQQLGQPGSPDPSNPGENISFESAMRELEEMSWLVRNGYLPTMGAAVPRMDLQDLQLLYRKNKTAKRFVPKIRVGSDERAETWDDWVAVSLGSGVLHENVFDPLYLLALDGFTHTYRNATSRMTDLPVSVDVLLAQELMDPETNEMLASLDPDLLQTIKDPAQLSTARVSVSSLIEGSRVTDSRGDTAAPDSDFARRRREIREWRRKNGVPLPLDVSLMDFRKNGNTFVTAGTSNTALMRTLLNVRVGMALFNPALYISMGPEQWIRGTLDRTANLLTGQATTGWLAHASAKSTEKAAEAREAQLNAQLLQLNRRLENAKGAERDQILKDIAALDRSRSWREIFGFQARFTTAQLTRLQALYNSLGNRNDFRGFLYRELSFQREISGARIGWAEKASGRFADAGARVQDPTWGVHANTLARRYMEAALQEIMLSPLTTGISVDTLISEMKMNPAFLKDRMPEVHKAAMNAVAQLRSLKATPGQLALRSIIDGLSTNPNAAINTMGNLFLKIPLIFSTYALNVATTITGMQGYSDWLAVHMHGKKKGKIVRAIQRAVRGVESTDPADAYYDMSDAIEGLDLTRSFIRSGLTHTGLFAMGLLAGGLGLSGDDEETKRRRQAAYYQGFGMVYDARSVENDFRNADAVFSRWLPTGMGSAHWILKQFLSPMIGMERFFETGDFRQVMWGFQDALGSFPLINTTMWWDTVETAEAMFQRAQENAKSDDPAKVAESVGLLVKIVATYESMLMENSFVNSLYVNMDGLDRDPYAMPELDSDGVRQVDAEGQPTPSSQLVQYVNEDGEVLEGYVSRDKFGAQLRTYTETRGTLAFLTSMLSMDGLKSDYLRYNMVPKIRSIEKAPLQEDQIEAMIIGAMAKSNTLPMLTEQEALNVLIAQIPEGSGWVDYESLRPAAKKMAAESGTAALSLVDEAGREHLTDEGAEAIFQGIIKGSVKVGDGSLNGIYITPEMRRRISDKWHKELLQEGLDLGLNETQANYRVTRLMAGPFDNSEVKGLGDVLWDKRISYSDTLQYQQLNSSYVMGPDGRPWATGFERGNKMQALLGALGLRPFTPQHQPASDAMGADQRFNSTDLVANVNTGLRALKPLPAEIPTDIDIAKELAESFERALKDFKPSITKDDPDGSKRSGWRNFGRRSYGRRGGGGGYGGYSSGGFSQWVDMYRLPEQRATYGQDMPYINTSNPIIRRASIRRERVWSERGRLKQWQ